MEGKTRNIYQRMAAVTAELQAVAKNMTVQVTKNSTYKAVSERDVLDAVKPMEEKHGIFSYPRARTVILAQNLDVESTYNGNTTKKTQFMMRLETVYRFVNIDNPEEFIEVVTYGDGIDSGDKACGKAMTYADKYALMKAYKISTGEDPDQEASKEENYRAVTTGGIGGFPDQPDYITDAQYDQLRLLYVGENLLKLLDKYKVKQLRQLPRSVGEELLAKWQELKNKK